MVFTRILTSKLEELGLYGYFEGNHREREFFLTRWNQLMYRLRQRRAKPENELGGLSSKVN